MSPQNSNLKIAALQPCDWIPFSKLGRNGFLCKVAYASRPSLRFLRVVAPSIQMSVYWRLPLSLRSQPTNSSRISHFANSDPAWPFPLAQDGVCNKKRPTPPSVTRGRKAISSTFTLRMCWRSSSAYFSGSLSGLLSNILMILRPLQVASVKQSTCIVVTIWATFHVQ